MNVWLIILGMAAVTFAVRLLPVLTMRGQPDPRLERAFRYVPPAILSALILPALLLRDNTLATGPELIAGLVGVLVAFITRNMALTIVAGLGAYAILLGFGLMR